MAAGCLAEFKACVAQLYTSNCTELNDNSPCLISLFKSIEKVFKHGLKEFPSLFGEPQQYCWNVFEKLEKCSKEFSYDVPYSLSAALDKVNECKRVKTAIGKGRLFLRILAKNGSLGDLVLLLKENKSFLLQFYERSKSILTNDVQCQIFYSFVADFTRIKFELNIDGADFLDTTWEIPVYMTKDFVPCSHLGIRVRFLESYYIITELEKEFYVNGGGFFELGDVITSLAGNVLRGKVVDLQKILTRECRTLLRFEVAKVRTSDGTYFKPILNILKKRGYENILDLDEGSDTNAKLPVWPDTESLDLSACYAALGDGAMDGVGESPSSANKIIHSVRYVGSMKIGSRGDTSHIPEAIELVLAENPSPSHYMPVRVRLGELDVSVWPVRPSANENDVQSEPFLKHAYPSISAVGHRKQAARYFGYIAGNSTCIVATSFTAYVFLCVSKAEASRIVKGMSNGFKRTNWTM
ncbi:Pleckstrin homology domain-containing family M member 2 [Taenia solium]|eukprot:TsM_000119800 transcript=TsM_000119800 gene=TsM_000119800